MNEFKNGWRELAGATVGLACGIGSFTPVISLFFRPLEAEFGWTKTQMAGCLVALPLAALFLPFVGGLLDRFGVRRVAFLSVLLLATGYLGLSLTNGHLALFYAVFASLWVLSAATGPIAYTRTIAQNFKRRRGTALAIALLGVAAAGVALPPVVAAVLESGGWRRGYQLMAVVALVGGTLAAWLTRPQAAAAASAGEAAGTAGLGPRQGLGLLGRSEFWFLGAAIFFVSAGSLGFVSQFQSILVEKGIAATHAPILISMVAASVFVSRIVVGALLDVAPAERVAAGVTALASIGFAVWLLGPATFTTGAIAIVLIAFSVGGELDLMSFFCARLFGLPQYARSYGALSIFFYCGIAAGGIAYGVSHDRTGSYAGAITASGLLFLVAAFLFYLLRSASDRAVNAAVHATVSATVSAAASASNPAPTQGAKPTLALQSPIS